MTLPQPDAFAAEFSARWKAKDADALAALFAEDADFLSLTGAWVEGRDQIATVLKAELAGAFAKAKLVTGRTKLRPVGPHTAVVLQRYVLSGLVNADGSDAGRIGTVLSATLAASGDSWHAVAAQFTVES